MAFARYALTTDLSSIGKVLAPNFSVTVESTIEVEIYRGNGTGKKLVLIPISVLAWESDQMAMYSGEALYAKTASGTTNIVVNQW
jgi:hypothetical protein